MYPENIRFVHVHGARPGVGPPAVGGPHAAGTTAAGVVGPHGVAIGGHTSNMIAHPGTRTRGQPNPGR